MDRLIIWGLCCVGLWLGSCAPSAVRSMFDERGYRYPLHVEHPKTGERCREGGDGQTHCPAPALLRAFERDVAPRFAQRHCLTADASRFWPDWVVELEGDTFLETYLECFGTGTPPPVHDHSCLPGETCACVGTSACFIVKQHHGYWQLSTQVSFRLTDSTWQFAGWGWKSQGPVVRPAGGHASSASR